MHPSHLPLCVALCAGRGNKACWASMRACKQELRSLWGTCRLNNSQRCQIKKHSMVLETSSKYDDGLCSTVKHCFEHICNFLWKKDFNVRANALVSEQLESPVAGVVLPVQLSVPWLYARTKGRHRASQLKRPLTLAESQWDKGESNVPKHRHERAKITRGSDYINMHLSTADQTSKTPQRWGSFKVV